ncbi:lytic transglycosylase domain-containing protein [Nocardioides sp. JQ2195]|uniref:lytic murein transglycosylase n=1 Tax=Nocardioides sp. JQ2195 TaxID=2592334 RepID=UPI00143E6514|nr:lytic murein transglycosylase [Nocardioides sp. JQ2195]QIX28148.1 lytic transglycosylase domain-containing protein [Nocardioides sp. JQ2195]
MALVPLALLSTAWTASLVGVGGGTVASAADSEGRLPDGTAVPTEAIEDPASFSQPGSLGLGVPKGDGAQIVQTASTNGVPSAALAAYQRAATVINAADKSCQIPWELVAAIGRVESDHGRTGNNTLGKDGISRPGIYGIALDGSNDTQEITDTDAGQFDRDAKFDRAVGPMQFIPSTWSVVGVDADGDGERNPQDVDDAALAAAVYLCSGNDDLSSEAGQRSAVYRYNHSEKYVDLVLRIKDAYMSGDYSSVPNNTTSAISIPTDYTFTQPTNGQQLGSPQSEPANNGTQAASGAEPGTSTNSGSTDSGSTGTQTDPTPTVPTTNDPGETIKKGIEDGKKAVEETVKKVTDPVTQTLTKTQATTQCLASGILALDVNRLNACIADLMNP